MKFCFMQTFLTNATLKPVKRIDPSRFERVNPHYTWSEPGPLQVFSQQCLWWIIIIDKS